jgi:phage tail tape-measure protein
MKNVFVMFVLFVSIGGYVSEDAYAGMTNKAVEVIILSGPDVVNLVLEPTAENAVGLVGDGVGSLAGGVGGTYVGAAIGTVICPGAGTAVGGFVGYWIGSLGGGYVGENAAKKAYHQFK